jgi:hypothetical protein
VVVGGGTVVVVVLGGLVVVVGGRVVVVGGSVVVVVLRIGLSTCGALAGEGAAGGLLSAASSALVGRDGIDVRDDALPPPSGRAVVIVLPTTFVVVVVPLLAAWVGAAVVPFRCCTASVGGGVLVPAKAHTAAITASPATTSATPGYQTPSR